MPNRLAIVRFSRRRWWLAATAAACLALLWIALRVVQGGKIQPGLLSRQADQTPNRPLGTVTRERITLRHEVVGSVQSRMPVEAASRVAARVTEVKVRAGDRVGRGQVLVALDAAELRAKVAQAEGELAAARAELARATADHQRFAALFSRGSVTAHERDAAEAAYRSAAGRAAQAAAAVSAARAALVYTVVRSPVEGVVVERLVEPGDMALVGKPLVRLYDNNALRVELAVPEDLARYLAVGTPLDVRVDAARAVYHAQVSEIVPAADPASRSFLVRAPLAGRGHLRPGMFARASFAAGSQTLLTVPRAAVERIGQLDTVRVDADGTIQTRMVSLGRGLGARVEVLAGLHEGDRVILDHTQAAVR
jgi:RND family efflux transporter MFP subunit